MNFLGDESFEAVSPSIHRVSVSNGCEQAYGTGFVIGKLHKTGQLILATARHVLVAPGDGPLTWTVAQYDRNGKACREIQFTTGANDERVPFRWHRNLDVAVMTLPEESLTKAEFSGEQEGLRLIDPQKGVSTGTRIAWAGFPGTVEDLIGHPQLCYFEGSVSAMVDRDDKRLYIADGHVAPGVSGGPVWSWSESGGVPEVVGIVSSYALSETTLPGFCVFEPINPLFYYLANWHAVLSGGYDNFVVMKHGGGPGNAT